MSQTPEYAEFRKAMPDELIPLVNALEHSYRWRKQARARAKTPTMNIVAARQSWLQFGHFDDCGPSYTSEYDDAKAKIEEWIPAKIRAEKYHKLCGHKFIEGGGTKEQLTQITNFFITMHHTKD